MIIDKMKQNDKECYGTVVDFGTYEPDEFFPYEGRHERAQLFHYYYDMIPDDKKYEIYRDIWDSVDNMQYLMKPKILRDVFNHRSNIRKDITKSALSDFTDCDGMLTIYRGTYKGARKGWSWTLNLDVAHWFARRLESKEACYFTLAHGIHSAGAKGEVLKGKAHIDDVMDYLNGRHEFEVIIDPKKVVSVVTEEVDEAAAARQKAALQQRIDEELANLRKCMSQKLS